MTIEEKAKAYDKALNIAREILDHTSENYLCTHLTKEDIKDMYIRFFPELEESEDEKIRKSLISYLHGLGEFDYPDKKTYNDWLKWVEKQKSYVSPQMVADAYLRGCNETEEKLLEKQGEQKLQIEKLPSEIKTIGESLDFTTQEECDEYNQMVSDLIMSNSDKIEPKFKVGDWITNGDYTWKIVEVKPLDYMLQSQNGNIIYDTISYVDEQFHSFTIQDAKDGEKVSSAWDKEDEEIMSGLLSFLLINTSDQWAKYGKWILSLKERMKG